MSSDKEVYSNLRDLDRARISHCIFLPWLPPQIYKLFPLKAQLYLFIMYPLWREETGYLLSYYEEAQFLVVKFKKQMNQSLRKGDEPKRKSNTEF